MTENGVHRSLLANIPESEFIEECDYDNFEKLKYSNFDNRKIKFTEEYDDTIIDSGQILLELKLGLDPFKTISQRESVGILDYLADLGGFYATLDIAFFYVASFFSSKFFIASIARYLFLKPKPLSKLTKKQKQQKKEAKKFQPRFGSDNEVEQIDFNEQKEKEEVKKEEDHSFETSLIRKHF